MLIQNKAGAAIRSCDVCGVSKQPGEAHRYIALANYQVIMADGSELELCSYHYGLHEIGLITRVPRPQIKSLATN